MLPSPNRLFSSTILFLVLAFLQGMSLGSKAAITVNPTSLVNWTVNKSGYSQTVSGTGGSTPYTYSVTVGTLPTGLTLTPSTGAITGTPTVAGTSNFTITATDSTTATGNRAYSIVINPALAITTTTLANWTINKAGYSQTITTSGGTPAITFAVTTGTLPTGLTLTSSTGAITGTPTVAGTSNFTITATDASGATAAKSLTIVINAVPSITTTTLPNWTLNKAGYSQTIATSNGTAPITFAVTTGTLPTGLTLASSTGVVSGTPTAAGTSNFTVTATDAAGATAAQAYTVVINAAITVSPASLPNWTINRTGYSQPVTSANGTGARTLSISAGAVPTGMTFTPATGVLNGTPTAAGTFNFTVTSTDTVGATGSQAYTIIINAVPTITTTTLPNWTINRAGYSQTIATSNGTSPFTFAVTTGTLPTGLTLASSTGVVSGTPTVAGTSNFTITATDAAGATAAQAYTVVINAVPSITTTTLPNWTINRAGYSQTIATTGGTAAITFAVTTGTLPTGLTLASSTGVVSGTPTVAGTSNFTVTATDAAGATAAQAYSVVIAAAVTVSPSTLPNWTINKTGYSQTVTSANGTGTKTLSISAGAVPTGMTFTAATGVLNGTPTAAGTFNFTVTATDTVGATGSQAYSIIIAAAVTVSPASLPNWTINRTGYSQTVTSANGTGARTLSISAGAVPTGMTFTPATGVLNGTPTAAGTFTFTVTATDTVGATGSQAYTIIINAVPSITTTSLPNWTINKTGYSQTIATSNGTSPITFAVTTGTLPTGLTITGSSGLVSGTPTAAGTSNFTITATDAAGATAAQAYTVVIAAAVTVTPASMPNWTINRTGYSQTVTSANGTGTKTLSISAGAVPTGMTFTPATGVLNGTPTATGTFTFTVTATDAVGAIGSQAYSIVINAVPAITTASLANWTINKTGYSQTIATTGGTAAISFAVTTGTLPTGLTLTSSSGLVSGTPTVAGTSNFTVTATDAAGATASQAYTVVIAAAVTVSPTTLPNWTINKTGYSQTVTSSNGTGTKTLSISAGAVPTGMTFTPATGVLTGTPTATGTFNFTVTATDAVGATGSQAYTIIINAAPAITTATSPNWTINQPGYSVTYAGTGGTGALGFTLTAGAVPDGLTFSAVAGTLTGTPTTAGTFNFTVTATDTVGATAAQAYTVVINPAVGIDTPSIPAWTVNQPGYSITISGTNGTGTKTLALTQGSVPTGMTFIGGVTGQLSGTPTDTGTFNFTITATDSVGAAASIPYSMIIYAGLAIPAANLATWTAGLSGYRQPVSVVGNIGTPNFSLSSGTLPNGIGLSTAGLLSGTPNTANTFNFTVMVSDTTTGSTATQSFTIIVNPAISMLAASLPNWTVGKTGYSQTLSSTGGTGTATYAVTVGTVPSGLTFTPATGALTGTPTAEGNYGFTVTATDSLGAKASQPYSVTVNPAVTISPASLPNWSVNRPGYSQTITSANGTGTRTLSLSSGSLPAGLAFTPATGQITGTPTALGTSNFSITATDSIGASTTASYTIIINSGISITTTSMPDWTINKSGYNQTIASDGGTGSVNFAVTAGSLPPGLVFNIFGNLSGTPNTAGTYNFTVTATDSVGATGPQAYTIVVNPVIRLSPTTLPNWTANFAGYSKTFTFTGGTGTVTYAVTSGTLPPGLTLGASTGVLDGTPTTAGTYAFTVTGTDSVGATGVKNFSVVISAPVAISTSTLPDWTINKSGYSSPITVTGGTGTLTYSVTTGSLPAGLTLSTGGVLSGTPTTAGVYPFTISATDTVGAADSKSYSVTINPVLSFTTSSLPNWTVNLAGYSQTIVTAGGTGTKTIALASGTLPTGLTLSTVGLLSGTPTAVGTFNATLSVTDASGATLTKPYSITINAAVAVTTSALPGGGLRVAGYSQTITATGGTGTLSFAVTNGTLPPGLTLSSAGLVSGTPTQNGNFIFTVTATDSLGATGFNSCSIVISNAAPTLNAPSSASVTGVSATLGATVIDDGGAAITTRGVVLVPTSVSTTPRLAGTGVIVVSTTGTTGLFTVSAASLTPGTAYTYCGYATNSVGTSYSPVDTFTTLKNNALLSGLVLSKGTLSPVFAANTTSYTCTVNNNINSLTLTPTTADSTATVTVNGTPVTSGTASSTLALTQGDNVINTVVTAQDGTTTSTYTVTITRLAPFIEVQQPVGSVLDSGTATVDFGAAAQAKNFTTRSFTAKNIGLNILVNFAFTFDGANASDFTVSTAPSKTLAAGSSTTFVIKFAPLGVGSRSAMMHITAVGATDSSFDINLTGIGAETPSIGTPPTSKALKVGDTLMLTHQSTGGGMSYQWLKNGIAIKDATQPSFTKVVGLADAGAYTIKITNPAGVATSVPANVGVVSTAPSAVGVLETKTLSLTVTAAGPNLVYAWKKGSTPLANGPNPVNAASVIAGATGPTLTISKIVGDDAGVYTCDVRIGNVVIGSEMSQVTSGNFTVTITVKPTLDAFTAGPWIVGGPVTETVVSHNAPTAFTLSGQPTGVSIDSTGRLTGKPMVAITVPTTYHLVIGASNAAGAATSIKTDVLVQPLPADLLGTFNGLIDRDSSITASHGGTLNLVTTNTSVFSGKITVGGLNYPFLNQNLVTSASGISSASVTIKRTTPLHDLTLALTFHHDRMGDLANAGKVEGTLTDVSLPAAPVNLLGWRATAQTNLATVYNAVLQIDSNLAGTASPNQANIIYPQGDGFGSLTVTAAGAATWSGKMADGTATTAAITMGPHGEVPLHFMLYTNTGSAHGWVKASGSDPSQLLDTLGTFNWLKKPQTAVTLNYANGFPLHNLSVIGGKYVKPTAASPLVLGLGPVSSGVNAALKFSDGGLEALTFAGPPAVNIAGAANINELVDNAAFRLAGTAAANTFTAPSPNKAAITFTVSPTTGIFSGSFTLHGDQDPTKTTASLTINRTATFNGICVTRATGMPTLVQGVGYFLLSELQPAPGLAIKSAPILSGQVTLDRSVK